ncbi:MAG TPA: hypothetical protein VEV83_20285 [Parafilimonas sp.]|nr:hypothetical protein [Parafilimonas sp.]
MNQHHQILEADRLLTGTNEFGETDAVFSTVIGMINKENLFVAKITAFCCTGQEPSCIWVTQLKGSDSSYI